jgi:hypothetical protein
MFIKIFTKARQSTRLEGECNDLIQSHNTTHPHTLLSSLPASSFFLQLYSGQDLSSPPLVSDIPPCPLGKGKVIPLQARRGPEGG